MAFINSYYWSFKSAEEKGKQNTELPTIHKEENTTLPTVEDFETVKKDEKNNP